MMPQTGLNCGHVGKDGEEDMKLWRVGYRSSVDQEFLYLGSIIIIQ